MLGSGCKPTTTELSTPASSLKSPPTSLPTLQETEASDTSQMIKSIWEMHRTLEAVAFHMPDGSTGSTQISLAWECKMNSAW